MIVASPRVGVITFPGSLDDRDALRAIELDGRDGRRALARGPRPARRRRRDPAGRVQLRRLPALRGDRRHASIMDEVKAFAERGGPVLGICNGFQILCEAGLLPGALIRNRSLRFVCRDVFLRVETAQTPVTAGSHRARCSRSRSSTARASSSARAEELRSDRGRGLVVFRYTRRDGVVGDGAQPERLRRPHRGRAQRRRQRRGADAASRARGRSRRRTDRRPAAVRVAVRARRSREPARERRAGTAAPPARA